MISQLNYKLCYHHHHWSNTDPSWDNPTWCWEYINDCIIIVHNITSLNSKARWVHQRKVNESAEMMMRLPPVMKVFVFASNWVIELSFKIDITIRNIEIWGWDWHDGWSTEVGITTTDDCIIWVTNNHCFHISFEDAMKVPAPRMVIFEYSISTLDESENNKWPFPESDVKNNINLCKKKIM